MAWAWVVIALLGALFRLFRQAGPRTRTGQAASARRVAARPDDPVLAGRSAFADRSGGQAGDGRFSSLFSGETVAAVGLASDDVPLEQDGRLSGRASWVAPITDRGLAVVGPRRGGQPKLHARAEERAAYAVFFDTPGLTIEVVETAGLPGLVCGHVAFSGTVGEPIGAPLPVMTRIRIFMAAAGIGMGRRALDEALIAAKATHAAAAGEQTVQGLLADAATELDAATLMVWKAAKAAGGEPVSLADASLAKLMATEAALRAVEHATQVIGADSFQRGHIIERLAQDVRALELFAGRTEALREAVAEEILPLGVSLVPVPRKGEMTS